MNIKDISDIAVSSANTILANPYVMAVVKLTLTIYAVKIAPRLPAPAENFLENTFVKILLLTLMVYLSEKDFQLAILIGVIYVISLNMISGRGPLESFANYSSEYTSATTSKLIEPKTHIYPGCLNMTIADLEKAFDGDRNKLAAAVNLAYKDLLAQAKNKSAKEKFMQMAYATGLPYNVKLDDENAPYIATILLYRGFDLGGTCTAPN
jgi:hypothetical protein